jgi:hypothetical protein
MPILKLQLDSGIVVRAVAIYQEETYEGGLAIGRHSKERVDRKLKILRLHAERINTAPVLFLLPLDLGQGPRTWCLPYYTSIVWFVSEFVRDQTRMASHLAVAYFQDSVDERISAENETALRAIDWPRHAVDFDY